MYINFSNSSTSFTVRVAPWDQRQDGKQKIPEMTSIMILWLKTDTI